MKLSDLDKSTRKLVYLAHCVAKWPSLSNHKKLIAAIEDFDNVHKEEREANLSRALFGPSGILAEDWLKQAVVFDEPSEDRS